MLHLRVSKMCSILGLTPSLQNQKLHFNKIPSDFHAHKRLRNITGLYQSLRYLCRSHIPDYIVSIILGRLLAFLISLPLLNTHTYTHIHTTHLSILNSLVLNT